METIPKLRMLLLKEKLIKRLNEVRVEALHQPREVPFELSDVPLEELTPAEDGTAAAFFARNQKRLEDIFDEEVLGEFDPPVPILAAELFELFSQFAAVEDQHYQCVYKLFVGAAIFRVTYGKEFPGLPIFGCDFDVPDQEIILQLASGQLELHSRGVGEATAPWGGPVKLGFAALYCDATDIAAEAYIRLLLPVIRTALVTCAESELMCSNKVPFLFQPFDFASSIFKRQLECYHKRATFGKNSLHRRVANAIRLLIAADDSDDLVVKTVMCMASMEALVCEKSSDGVVAQLAERTATLLEPDPLHRLDAVQSMRDLYSHRSNYAHGRETAESPDVPRKLRRLASRLVRAICERIEYQKTLGEDAERADNFFTEVEASKLRGLSVVGISTVATDLWQE